MKSSLFGPVLSAEFWLSVVFSVRNLRGIPQISTLSAIKTITLTEFILQIEELNVFIC